jgi:ABC-type cobalt transport system substrate-binding protein
MRIILITSILLNFIFPCYSQKSKIIPITGTYEMGLQVCYNPATGEISGILSFDNAANKLSVHISCDQYFTGYHRSSDLPMNFLFSQDIQMIQPKRL